MSVRAQLRHIVATYGPGVATDAARCRGLLLDHCPPGDREGLELVVAAVELGGVGRLLGGNAGFADVSPTELANELVTASRTSPAEARRAVGTWLLALDRTDLLLADWEASATPPRQPPVSTSSAEQQESPRLNPDDYEWYYIQDQAQQGPVEGAELLQMLSTGVLPADTPVYCDALADWAPAATIPCFTWVQGAEPTLAASTGTPAKLESIPQHRLHTKYPLQAQPLVAPSSGRPLTAAPQPAKQNNTYEILLIVIFIMITFLVIVGVGLLISSAI